MYIGVTVYPTKIFGIEEIKFKYDEGKGLALHVLTAGKVGAKRIFFSWGQATCKFNMLIKWKRWYIITCVNM